MSNESTDRLGFGMSQKTINYKVDHEKIKNIFKKNLDQIEKLYNKDDQYEKEFFDGLKKEEIIFPLNKHVEFFVLNHSSNIKKIFKYMVFRYKFFICGQKQINLGYPPYLLIEPVAACNLRCPFCFQMDKTFTRKPFMGVIDFEFFKKIVDEADQIGVGAITLASRGEPTMHKKIKEMIEYVRTKENIFEIKLNTNGTYLNDELCHTFFKNNITQLVVSSDHYIKEDYERLRLGSNFEKVVANVDNLYKIRNKFYPDSITEIRISGVDNDKNLDRTKFYDFWIKRSDHVSATFASERWDTYNNKVHPEINDPCQLIWDRMYIWWDGKTNPCDADYKSYLSYGNAKENTIKELWNNKKNTELRNMHLNGDRNKINPCNKCGESFC